MLNNANLTVLIRILIGITISFFIISSPSIDVIPMFYATFLYDGSADVVVITIILRWWVAAV